MEAIQPRPSFETKPSLETPLVDEAFAAVREQAQPPAVADIQALKAEVSRLQESVALITEQSRDLMLRPVRDRPLTTFLSVAAFAFILGKLR